MTDGFLPEGYASLNRGNPEKEEFALKTSFQKQDNGRFCLSQHSSNDFSVFNILAQSKAVAEPCAGQEVFIQWICATQINRKPRKGDENRNLLIQNHGIYQTKTQFFLTQSQRHQPSFSKIKGCEDRSLQNTVISYNSVNVLSKVIFLSPISSCKMSNLKK